MQHFCLEEWRVRNVPKGEGVQQASQDVSLYGPDRILWVGSVSTCEWGHGIMMTKAKPANYNKFVKMYRCVPYRKRLEEYMFIIVKKHWPNVTSPNLRKK